MFGFFRKIFGIEKSQSVSDLEFNIVGIGNIGDKYEGTRHNIGFDAVRLFSEKLHGEEWRSLKDSKTSFTSLKSGKKTVALLPQTFVNRSGDSVSLINGMYNIPAEKTLVVTDDFNIPLGTFRFRKKGSAGGHNGLKSIIEAIGDDFPRLRLGVGPLTANTSIIDFVLGRFTQEELDLKNKSVDVAAEAISYFCEEGIEAAMNKYNGRDIRH